MQKIIIIGGVAAGAATATKLKRQLGEHVDVTIFEKSSSISYANCALPYGISDFVTDDEMIKADKESMKQKGIKVYTNHEVTNIFKNDKTIQVKNLKKNTISKFKYDKLVLAMGAKKLDLPIEGLNNEDEVYSLKTYDDLKRIKDVINSKKKALVIGGGNVGVELVEVLAGLKMKITLVESTNKLIGFDFDMSSFVEKELIDKGINLYMDNPVEKVNPTSKTAILKNGEEIEYDIIFTTGITPNTEFIKNTHIKMIDGKYIKTNNYMQTNDKDIYAAGDLVLTPNFMTGKKEWLPFAWNAKTQSRIVADHISNLDTKKQFSSLGASIAKVFDKDAGKIGLTEYQLKEAKIPYRIISLTKETNPRYMKNAGKLVLKVMFHAKTKVILGVQAFGEKADKTLDTLGMAIKNKMNILDLEEVNLVYQPQYSAPISLPNLVGQIVRKEQRYGYISICPFAAIDSDRLIIDVRSEKQHKEKGHLKGAINIPTNTFAKSKQLPKDFSTPIAVHCNTGFGSSLAAVELVKMGYTDVANVYGGNEMYQRMKLKDLKGEF